MKKRTSSIHSAAGTPPKRRNRLLALEPRMLFDGAALHDTAPIDHHDTTTELARVAEAPAIAPPATQAPATNEVVFIDSRVPETESLVAGIRPNVLVVRLDAAQDPFEQISAVLRDHPGTTAMHLVSHGGAGFLSLGGQSIDEAGLADHAEAIAQWKASLAQGADLLIYGCDVASGDAGRSFIGKLAEMTGADVAASRNTTGSGGDWTLETATGAVEAGSFLTEAGASAYQARLSTISLASSTGWVPILVGSNFDPNNDTQSNAADTDLIGDSAHPLLYAAYDDGGTSNTTADDTMAFRLRIDNPTSSTYFGGVALIGMDANLDGKIDIFFAVDGRNNGQAVRLFDPGTDANVSPNTTSTSPLPTGWVASNGVYSFSASNYSVNAVSAGTDPNWTGNADLGADGKTDVFVSFKIPFTDIATVLSKASPTDRNGTPGPRGTTGISGFTKDTVVRYIAMTQTQTGPINGDIGGVGASYDKNATFSSLGSFSDPMSPSNPVPAATTLTVSEPIDPDGILNATEDDATAIYVSSNLADHSKTFTVSVADGANHTLSGTASYDAVSGKWKLSEDLSALNDGTLTITATYDPDNDAGTLNSVSDTATVLHDKTPPLISIDQLATTTTGTPKLSGTTDLAAGSIVTITVDNDNVSSTANLVYRALVVAGMGGVNTWSVNTATATPVSGTFPTSGLSSYSKITASVQDAAGNSASAIALNRPTVASLSTNGTTPTVNGTWTNIAGDTLTVTVSGATYTLNPSGNSWSLNLATATPSSGTLTPLVAGQSYEVVATVSRTGMVAVSDTTSAELTITNTPVPAVSINGGDTASGSDTTPAISGTSANAGGFVIVRLDPNNDGDLSDAVTYSVTPDGSGNWTLDTGSATPISGITPSGGFTGNIGIRATDSSGTAADTQVLTVSAPTVAIGSITSAATSSGFGIVNNTGAGANWLNMTEDDSVTISGTATNGYAVNLVVSDANGNYVSSNGLTVTTGAWSVSGLNLSNLDNTTLTVTATLSGTGISASNTSVTHDKTAPQIFNTTQSVLQKTSGATINGTSDLLGKQLTVTLYSDASYTTAISGQTYNVTTDGATGVWSVTTTSNLPNLTTVYIRVAPTSQVTDTAGNIAQQVDQSRSVSQSTGNSDKSINVKPITGDNLIEVNEISAGLTIAGETNLTSSTVTVTITDGTTTLTKTATSGGTYTVGTNNWSVSLTQAEVQSLKNGPIQVTGSVTDTSKGVNVTDVELATLSLPSPTITITDNIPGTAAGDITFTFTFSEDMVASGTDATKAFTASDITVTNGTKGTFTKISPTVYTLVVTPTASSSGTVSVSVASGAAYGINSGRGNATATGTQAYNTTDPSAGTPPTLTVDASSLETDSTPLITGTTTLPAGASVIVTIDPDNDASTSNSLTYSAMVQSNGTWSLDLDTATPSSGTLPAAGLYTYAKITASATNAFGYNTKVTALDRPTVTSQITNDTTPTIGGTWTNVAGDSLTVTVGGVTYNTGSGLNISGNTWSLTTNALTAGTKEVVATTTRSGGGSISDSTSNELVIDTTAPAVSITSASATKDTTPVISGTTDLPAGSTLTITIDPDNDPSTDNSVSYNVIVVDGGGTNTWSVDTGSAIPANGTFPSAGLAGDVGVKATGTDAAGNSTSATQTINVDIIPPVVSITSNSKTPDTTPVISGSTDLPSGSTITLVIDPDNVPGGTTYTYTTTVQTGGVWTVDTGSATPSGESAPVTYTNGNTLGLSASGTDDVGNTGTATKAVQITTAPTVTVTTPIDGEAGQDGNGSLSATEDDTVVIKGTTTASPGSTLHVTLTDGTTTISDTATVDGDGSWQLASLNLSGMKNGVISVTATYVDGSGDSYSGTATVLHDKTAGGGVSIDSITNDTGVIADFITSDTTLVFKGSATAGASVTLTLSDAGGQVFQTTVTADNGGNWTCDRSGIPLSEGSYTLTATNGLASASQAVVIDATAPAGPVTVAALTTADTTPSITGTATVSAGETLRVSVNGKTYTAGDGNLVLAGTAWTLTVPASDELSAGTFEVTATVTDTAGNVLADATANELTIGTDSIAPAAPALSLLPTSDSGSSDSDAKTSDDTPTVRISLQGTGATAPVVGDVVKVYLGIIEIGSATLTGGDIANQYVDITTTTLGTDGSKSLTATVTETSGNTSTASDPLAITLDTTAPALASATVNGTTLTLTYTEAGSGMTSTTPAATDFNVMTNGTVTVSISSVAVDAANKTVTLTLASAITNTDTVTLDYTPDTNKTQDVAGNAAFALSGQIVTNNSSDIVAPAAPALSLLASSDSGSSHNDAKTSDNTPTVRVSLEGSGAAAPVAGDTVKIYLGESLVGSATLTGSDIANLYVDITTSTLGADSTKNLTATVTDAANNVSAASNTLTILLDTTVPVLASARVSGNTLTLTYAESGSGMDSSVPAADDFAVTKNGSTGIGVSSVSLDAVNKTVTLTLASAVSGTDTVTLDYTPGTNSTQDIAGNQAVALASLAVTNGTADSTAPAAPGLSLLASSDSGTSSGDAKTNDDTPTVRVSLQGSGATAPLEGDVVKVYLDASQVGSATLSADDISNGYIDITTTTLGSDGAKSLTATVTDAATNVSDASNALALTLDTTRPVLASATVDDTSLVLTYTEAGTGMASTTPAATDFVVTRNGDTQVNVASVSVDAANKTITLTLDSAVTSVDAVTLDYSPGTDKAQDIAGNAAVALSGQAVTNNSVDSSAPAAPALSLLASSDSGTSSSDAKTSDDTPTVRVTLQGSGANAPVAGDVAKVYLGATLLGSATLGASDIPAGYVDITTSTLGTDGAKSLSATITDIANNTSAASSALDILLDTAAPALSSASVNGTTLTLTYTESGSGMAAVAPAAGDFSVSRNGVATVNVSSVSVDTANRTVTLTLAEAISNADVVSIDYTPGANPIADVAGNTASALAAQTVVNASPDIAAPAAPALALLPSSDSGISSSDAYTMVAAPTIRVSLPGTGASAPAAGDTVTVYAGGTQITTGGLTAGDIANGYIDLALPSLGADGVKSLTATVTDTTNNVSAPSGALQVTLDTIVAAPKVLLDNDTGTSGSDRITKSGAISVGNIEAGATVQYSIDGSNWSSNFSAAEGANTVFVRQTDVAGNISTATSLAFTLDTQVATPSIALVHDTGSSNSDKISADATLDVSGVETGAKVEYSLDGTTWSSSVTPVEGVNTVFVRQTDVAGNVSGASSLTFTLDTHVAAPSIALVRDTGSSNSDRITADAALDVSGVETGAKLEYSLDGITWGSSVTPAEGANTIFVRQTDVAGNVSGTSSLAFTLDTQVAMPSLALTHDTGSSDSDRITADGALDVSNIETGAKVEYSLDGATWSSSVTPVEGANTVFVRQTDVAGNVSASASLSFTLDPLPNAPSIVLKVDTGASSGDGLTNNPELTLSGIKTGATVQYSTDGVIWGSSFTPVEGRNTVFVRQVSLGGNISETSSLSFTLDRTINAPTLALATDSGANGADRITNNGALLVSDIENGARVEYSSDGANWRSRFTPEEGANTVFVRQTDIAGNISASTSLDFTLDTRVSAPVIALPDPIGSGGQYTSAPDIGVSGIETGAAVEYSTDGGAWNSGYVAREGANTVIVRQTDLAGNVSAAASVSFTINTLTVNPTPPATTPAGGTSAGTGSSSTGSTGSGTSTSTGNGTISNPAGGIDSGLSPSMPAGVTESGTSTGASTSNGAVTSSATSVITGTGRESSAIPASVSPGPIVPVIGGSSAPGATSASGFAADIATTQPGSHLNLLAGIPQIASDSIGTNGNGPASSVLESTDRGFPVSRVQTPGVGGATAADRQDYSNTSNANGVSATPAGSIDLMQQKGGDRLFVYQGIRDTGVTGGEKVDYFVPREAFGHTNMNAVVQLDATLTDGSPLPEWLDFDPVSGRFSGRPPADEHVDLAVKVTARDNDGREASSTFHLRVQPTDKHAAADTRDGSPVKHPAGAKDAGAIRIAEGTAHKSLPFREQLRMAKPAHDPLLARIAGKDSQPVKTGKPQRIS